MKNKVPFRVISVHPEHLDPRPGTPLRKRVLSLLPLLVAAVTPAFAQTDDPGFPWQGLLDERPQFPEVSREEALEETREERVARISAWEEARAAWVAELAGEMKIPVVDRDPETGAQVVLKTFDPDGFPIYEGADNVEAAITTNAAALRDRRPYLVDGRGVTVGVWDGGAVRASHQEFGTRVSVHDGADPSDHATHVAGTIGAAGVQANAEGMAPGVLIRSYDNIFDLSEIQGEGAMTANGSGLHLTNHSYGYRGGWLDDGQVAGKTGGSGWHWPAFFSTNRHKLFGRYSPRARRWDDFVYTNRYTLPIMSAGNERNHGPEDGDTVYRRDLTWRWKAVTYDSSEHPPKDGDRRNGYETMTDWKNAKNHLTVGAMTQAIDPATGIRDVSQAAMSGFSSWGPTDDGRVKPDVVANGVAVLSSGNQSDTHYYTSPGTSMATPNVAGTAALLLDRYHDLNEGRGMRASLMKALLIHTADDVLNPGPDYQSGWGMVNASSAVHLMEMANQGRPDFALIEDHLDRGDGFRRYAVNISADDVPCEYKATLVWTDPPGEGTWEDDNRDLRLVNDLDLAVYNSSFTEVHRPFVLNPDDPDADATTGINNRDNVEQVVFTATIPGTYFIQVSEDIDNNYPDQYYSLLASPVLRPPEPDTLTINAPAGGLTRTIAIQAEGDWTASSADPWVSFPSGTSKTGDDTINVKIAPHFAAASRSALLTLSAGGNRGDTHIEIEQDAADPTDLVGLAAAIDQPAWTITTAGDGSWTGQTTLTDDGQDAATSPDDLLPGENASMSTTIEGPGRLTYRYRVDSDVGDYFSFRWNGSIFLQADGTGNPWQTDSFLLGPGTQQVEWRFENDSGGTAGLNRAFVDSVRIDKISLTDDTSIVPASGGEDNTQYLVTGSVPPVEVRNLPAWLTTVVDEANRLVTVIAEMNVTGQGREATIEVGNNETGWHELVVIQPAYTSPTPLAEVLGDHGWTLATSGPGFVGVIPEASFHDDELIVFGGPEYQQSLKLSAEVNGPGILRFNLKAGLNPDDFFQPIVDGEYQDRAGGSASGYGRSKEYVFRIEPGPRTVEWNLFKDTGTHPVNAGFLYDVHWLPVHARAQPLGFAAGGGSGTLHVEELAGDVDWLAEVSSESARLALGTPASGTGPGSVTYQAGPNYFGPENHRLFLTFEDGLQQFHTSFAIQQDGAPEIALADALELSGDFYLDQLTPDTRFPSLRGQSVSASDGEDSVVFAGSTVTRSLWMTLTQPALVSFDWRTENLAAGRSFQALVGGVVQAQIDHTVSSFQRDAVFVPAGQTLTWRLTGGTLAADKVNNLAFLDQVRIENAYDLSETAASVGSSGGVVSTRLATNARWELDDSDGFAPWAPFGSSQLSGEGSRELAFSVVENRDQSPRSTSYRILHPVWPLVMPPVEFTVTQQGSPPFTELEQHIGTVASDTSDFFLSIRSNEEWTASTDADWIRLEESSGSEDHALAVQAEPLPAGLNSRRGTISVNGETFELMQVRTDAIEDGYLTAVGAPNVESVLKDPRYMPLGNRDGDNHSNAIEWLFMSDPRAADGLPIALGNDGAVVPVRDTAWLSPVVGGSLDLHSFDTSKLILVDGDWTSVGSLDDVFDVGFEQTGDHSWDLLLGSDAAAFFFIFDFSGR